jgi:hypothetical protein
MLSGPGSSVNLGRYEQDRSHVEQIDNVFTGSASGRSEGLEELDLPSGLDGLDAMGLRGAAGRPAIAAGAVQSFSSSPRPEAPRSQLVQGAPPPAVAGTDSSTQSAEALIGIDEVQKALNRSRASVYRYTNTDPRNLNPPFNPRRLNPEYRSDQKDPLLFHPNEVARFARDVLRIKEVTVEVLNSPSTATQQLLGSILDELRAIRHRLDRLDAQPGLRTEIASRFDQHSRPAA